MDQLDQEVEGYIIPFCRPLTREVTILGVPREMFILNLTLGGVLILGLHMIYLIWIPFLIQFLIKWASKSDEKLTIIYMKRYLKQKKYYSD
jgi:type IV secretory pathway TrbD component